MRQRAFGSSLFRVGKFLKSVRVSDRALFHERHGTSSSSVRVGPTVDGGELSVRCREATSGHRAGLSPGEPFSLSLLWAGGLSGSRYGAKELAASELPDCNKNALPTDTSLGALSVFH